LHRIDRREPAHQDARRVHLDLLPADASAQPRIVDLLEPVFADHVVGRVAFVFARLVFVFGDRADVAEHLRAARSHRVVAHRLLFEIDAGDRRLFFGEPRGLRRCEIARQQNRSVRLVGEHLVEARVVHAEVMVEPMLEHAPVDAERRGERRQRRIDIHHLRGDERAHERGPAAHHHDAVPIDDQTARRGDRDQLDLVFARSVGERFALHELDLHEPRDDRNGGDGKHDRERDDPRARFDPHA
jgi:hypothetical protein